MSGPTEGVTYPLKVEKKRKQSSVIVIEAPFDEENTERRGTVEKKRDGRTLLSLPKGYNGVAAIDFGLTSFVSSGEREFVTFEAEDYDCDELLLLFDGKSFVLRPVTRRVKAVREIPGKAVSVFFLCFLFQLGLCS